MALRLGVDGDQQGIRQMLQRENAQGVSAIDELLEEYPDLGDLSPAAILRDIVETNARVIVDERNGIIRGVAVFRKVDEAWHCPYLAVDKTLSAQQRVDGAIAAINNLAGRFAPEVEVYGYMRLNGRLDTVLQQRGLTDRIEIGNNTVLYKTDCARLAVL